MNNTHQLAWDAMSMVLPKLTPEILREMRNVLWQAMDEIEWSANVQESNLRLFAYLNAEIARRIPHGL